VTSFFTGKSTSYLQVKYYCYCTKLQIYLHIIIAAFGTGTNLSFEQTHFCEPFILARKNSLMLFNGAFRLFNETIICHQKWQLPIL